jgi:hypothetical protein
MHILFTTIYSLQKQKLNHKQNSVQEINIGNFVQATEHDMHMYAKFGGLSFYGFLQSNTPRLYLYEFSIRK